MGEPSTSVPRSETSRVPATGQGSAFAKQGGSVLATGYHVPEAWTWSLVPIYIQRLFPAVPVSHGLSGFSRYRVCEQLWAGRPAHLITTTAVAVTVSP